MAAATKAAIAIDPTAADANPELAVVEWA